MLYSTPRSETPSTPAFTTAVVLLQTPAASKPSQHVSMQPTPLHPIHHSSIHQGRSHSIPSMHPHNPHLPSPGRAKRLRRVTVGKMIKHAPPCVRASSGECRTLFASPGCVIRRQPQYPPREGRDGCATSDGLGSRGAVVGVGEVMRWTEVRDEGCQLRRYLGLARKLARQDRGRGSWLRLSSEWP